MKRLILTYSIILLLFQKAIAFSEKHNKSIDTILVQDSLKTYITSQIIISDKSEFYDEKISSAFSKKIALNEKLSSISIGNLINSKSGIFARTYGAEGSLQTVSVRGAGSEYTSVFINGINYNNSLNGVFDFSKFSSDQVAEIIIKKGNDFDPLNNNAFGGVIELNPFEKSDTTKYSLKMQTGNLGFKNFNFNSSGSLFNTYYKLNLSHRSSRNDYEYTFNNEKGIRKNSDVSQYSINSTFINQFSVFNKTIKLQSFISFLDKNLGLPNFVSSNRHLDSKTREHEKNFSFSTNSKILFNNFFINGIWGFQNNKLSIDDPLLSINLRTRYFETNEKSFNSKLFVHFYKHTFKFSTGLTSNIETFDRLEIRENSKISNQFTRKGYSFNLTSDYSQKVFNNELQLNIALIFSQNYIIDKFSDFNRNNNFPNFRGGISINSNSNNLIIYANAGTGTRIPNYYEIIFSKLTSLSNRELEPEEIFNYETGIRYNKKSLFIELTYFNFDVKNKIIWQPQRVAFFSPVNAGRINSKGIEFNLEGLRLFESFYFSGNYTFTNAVKKSKLSESDNSYNKQIPYIPKHKSSISIQYINKNLNLNFTSNYYDRRFITEDNDVLFSLEPVFISNFSTTYDFSLFNLNLSAQILIQNLFNTSYQLIQSFPMPGREYRLTIQMEVK